MTSLEEFLENSPEELRESRRAFLEARQAYENLPEEEKKKKDEIWEKFNERTKSQGGFTIIN